MACYLQPNEYQIYGLASDVTDDWIAAASSLIDSHCRRPSLNPTQYSERLRIIEGSQTARLSHLPLAPLAPATLPFVSIQARYAKPRRGQLAYPVQEEVLWAFSLPGAWSACTFALSAERLRTISTPTAPGPRSSFSTATVTLTTRC